MLDLRKVIFLALPFFLYLLYGLYLGWFNPSIFEFKLEPKDPPGYYDYKGITHIHSNRSTGSGSPMEVFAAAKESGLDFIIMTDLNDFETETQFEGYDGRLLVLKGGEYSYLDSHLLYYDSPKNFSLTSLGQSQIQFTDLLSQKRNPTDSGFVVLAHPFKHRFSWTSAYPAGLDGIEAINLLSLWERAWLSSKASTIWSVLIFPFNQRLALFRLFEEPKQEIDLWDQLSQKRHTIALSGADAMAKASFSDQYLKIPSYQDSFQISSNHVLLTSELTGNTTSDRNKIMSAIKSGSFYFSLDLLADPKGFLTIMKTAKTTYSMGSEIKHSPGLQLIVQLPQKPQVPFEIVIMKDGNRYVTSNSQVTTMNVHSPGVYRVLVRLIPTLPLPDGKKWFPWIYTNAFYVN
ncbi:MAG: hypothetical protein AB7F59_06065 [Bdellovibrionales bacterium]